MRKEKLLAETQRHRMLETSGIDMLQGVSLISVDVQPEYENYLDFDLREYLDVLNSGIDVMNSLTFLFNGEETLGMVSLNDYQFWLIENGFEEQNLAQCKFYDKGYAFFRYCMDSSIEEDDVVALVKFMIANDVNDSREMNEEKWNAFMLSSDVDYQEVRDLMETSDDMINIPELMDYLSGYSGRLLLSGGGINECLKEVEIALMALDKPYNVFTQYTY